MNLNWHTARASAQWLGWSATTPGLPLRCARADLPARLQPARGSACLRAGHQQYAASRRGRCTGPIRPVTRQQPRRGPPAPRNHVQLDLLYRRSASGQPARVRDRYRPDPVLHLRRAVEGDMFETYLDAFEQTWAEARPAE